MLECSTAFNAADYTCQSNSTDRAEEGHSDSPKATECVCMGEQYGQDITS